jgi:hypothetical protein
MSEDEMGVIYRMQRRILFCNLQGKSRRERLRCKWEDDIKIDLREVGCEGGYWAELAQDTVQ